MKYLIEYKNSILKQEFQLQTFESKTLPVPLYKYNISDDDMVNKTMLWQTKLTNATPEELKEKGGSIWLYDGRLKINRWQYDWVSIVPDPIEEYKNLEKFKLMGEYIVTPEDVQQYELETTAEKYNL